MSLDVTLRRKGAIRRATVYICLALSRATPILRLFLPIVCAGGALLA